MKKLGVIGGLGPMATALFMKMVTEMTEAERDQEHIEIIIHSCPQIPDRTAYILGISLEDPAPGMMSAGSGLARQGVDLIAIPCITSSYFHDELQEGIPVPVIDIVKETVDYLMARGITKAGLMATAGTVKSGLFQRAFAAHGCELALPGDEGQERVMHIIYENVKAGRPVEMDMFSLVSEELRDQGAQVIILGCTELSVVRDCCDIGAGYLDAMQLMAKCAVESCGRLKEEYRELIA